MSPIKCLDTVPGALSLACLMSFTLNRHCFLPGPGGLRRDALGTGFKCLSVLAEIHELEG